jgi:hypothetical protein
MKNVNTNHSLIIINYPPVVRGLVLAVGVASASTAYAECQRIAAPETGLTTPWYKPADVAASSHHISLLDMVTELKKGGFPVASIAQFAGVERKTVYSWLDGSATPHPDREERVAAVYPVLKERFDGDFVLMYRVLRAKDRDGNSLESLFKAAKIDVEAVKRQLAVLDTSINTIKAAEARKKAKPIKEMAGINAAIDESPVAVFEDI